MATLVSHPTHERERGRPGEQVGGSPASSHSQPVGSNVSCYGVKVAQCECHPAGHGNPGECQDKYSLPATLRCVMCVTCVTCVTPTQTDKYSLPATLRCVMCVIFVTPTP